MTLADKKIITDLADQAFGHARYLQNKAEANDVPEELAYHLVSLLEWLAPSWEVAREAARHIVLTKRLGSSKKFLCSQFNLSY